MTSSPVRRRGLVIVAPALVTLLAACGSSGTSTSSGSAAGSTASAAAGGTAPGQGNRTPPGVSGQTVEVSGNTLQVRTADGQTAVQVSSSTRITELKAATSAAVTVGSCLVATGQPDASGAGLTARSVVVAPATGGTCADNGFGGPGGLGGPGPGRGGPGATGSAGSGAGSGTPGAGGQGAPVGTAAGTVTAVTPTSITLTGRLRTFTRGRPAAGARASGSAGRSAGPATTVTVTVSGTTQYTATVVETPSALAVGQCVTAIGPANDIGAVTARSITIRPAGPNGCATRFGRQRGRRADGSPGGTT
ncbi:MAG TPA: hypothetical protein VI248_16965, partial [Kineosporiaceae bacterium]